MLDNELEYLDEQDEFEEEEERERFVTVQTMGKKDCCSSIGDIHKHEKFKRMPMEQRIQKLQDVYDMYGVKSTEFFVQVKPFIMWTVYRYLRGMSYTYLEDLVNNAYEELVIAFDGGYTTYYNKPVYKEPIYGTAEYYADYKNIGDFVMYIVGGSTAKYRARTFRKQVIHEDVQQDISDRLNFTDFEINNDLGYEMVLEDDEPLLHVFKPNKELAKHLHIIKETQPRNNVLYNFMLWRERN